MSIVSHVKRSRAGWSSLPAVWGYISAYHTIPKSQTLLGIFLWTLLLLYFPLMILIILSALSSNRECGSGVRTSILVSLTTLWISVFQTVWSGALSMNIFFATLTSRFILYNVFTISDLYLMGIIWTNSSSMNIWAHVFPSMDLFLKIVLPCRTCNLFNAASATENMFCTS